MAKEKVLFEALESAYNVIFEVNLKKDTVKCIHGKETSTIGIYYDLEMTIDSAIKFWVNNYVYDDDRKIVKKFFDKISIHGALKNENRPMQIDFRIKTRRGLFFSFIGVALDIDEDTFLFCCRDITEVKYSNANKHIKIVTFGYFDIFVNEEPLIFSSAKAKELLAILVDHRGSFVTSEQAITCLWEDRPNNKQTQANYRKVALRLKNTLMENGIENIIEVRNGKRRIIPEKVHCDLFDYVNHKPGCRRNYKGSYLIDYPWAEYSKAELEVK